MSILKKYKLVLESNLVDDEFAPDLIRTITENVDNGTIDAEVTLVAKLATEILQGQFKGYNEINFYDRFNSLKNLANSVVFNSDKFYRIGNEWERKHDTELKKLLSKIKPDSILKLGDMLITSDILWKEFPMLNLHPAPPEVGPVGKYPNVMEIYVKRILKEIRKEEPPLTDEKLVSILDKREHGTGGMLFLVDHTIDRGPVISWYDFPLTSPELLQLFWSVGSIAMKYGTSVAENVREYRQIIDKIRDYQYPGENPLTILTYNKLTHGKWKIENRRLYIREDNSWIEYPNGYCLNQEIGEWLKERRIESLVR